MERQIKRQWLIATAFLAMSLLAWDATAACGGGVGSACTSSSQCSKNTLAKVCVSAACAIPCVTTAGARDPGACGVGEACVPATSGLESTFVCRAVPMVMDLNLLDTCIYRFVKNLAPNLGGAPSSCSADELLGSMLDRDSNGVFNIFDVDACIADFIEVLTAPCNAETQSCDNGQIYCDEDADCGTGAYCDAAAHFCRRECGLMVDRADAATSVAIDRPCYGKLKTCDYSQGRCVTVDLETCPANNPHCHACQVDSECPSGAYCFVGQCEAKCTSALDCPDAAWYCSKTNSCIPRPVDTSSATTSFNPKDYSILFAERQVDFTVTEKSVNVPVLMMNLSTRKPVFDDPNVVFGYRLETKYSVKQEPVCFGDLGGLYSSEKKKCGTSKTCIDEWEAKRLAVVDDCLILPEEEFVTMMSPFGTIYGDGDPKLALSLNMKAFDKLSPGLYEANLTGIFNNGDMDTVKVRVRKPTPSGEYFGRLTVTLDNKENTLGTGNVGAKLFVNNSVPMVEWDALLKANNLLADKEYNDVTRGYPVTGTIHGASGMLFDQPLAVSPAQNEIPVKGIYSPHLGRMRLVAVIEMPKGYCRAEDGLCRPFDADQLKVSNRFGRAVRRIVEFLGPFEPLEGLYSGLYRETISGLLPHDLTLEGSFNLAQMAPDGAPIVNSVPLLAKDEALGFPTLETLKSAISAAVSKNCPSMSPYNDTVFKPQVHFATKADFQKYLAQFGAGEGRIFSQLVTMEGEIGDALQALSGNQGAYLTLNDFLAGSIEFCEGDDTQSCIDRDTVQCGLALYRQAMVSSFVDLADLNTKQTHTLFCPDAPLPGSDCTVSASIDPALTVLHEHNRFYKELVQTYAYEAGNAVSDAFYVMYKAAQGTALAGDSAYEHKLLRLSEALAKYETMRSELYSPEATAIMLGWPMGSFSGQGNSWLQYLATASSDRLDTLLELLDLKRRVQQSLDVKAEVFASHLLHDEYLVQVLIAATQKQWQGSRMQYAGFGPQMMERGDLVLAKVSQARNPLGLHDRRVFFENGDLSLNNWQAYRKRVEEGLVGLDQSVQQAIGNLQGALRDKDGLEASVQTATHDAERQIDDLCGPDDWWPDELPPSGMDSNGEPVCEAVSAEDRFYQKTCTKGEEGCYSTYTCDDSGSLECASAIAMLNDGVEDIDNEACRTDVPIYSITFAGSTGRTCIRGRMGSLLRERTLLRLQKEANLRRFNLVLRQIARQQKYLAEVLSHNSAIIDEMNRQTGRIEDIQTRIMNAELAMGIAEAVQKGLNCEWPIIGIAAASPGNCVAVIPGSIAWGIAKEIFDRALGEARQKMAQIQSEMAVSSQEDQDWSEKKQIRQGLDSLLDQVDSLIIDYDTTTQQLFSVNLQLDDTLYLARQAAARYGEVVEGLVDRLIGRETGSVLLRNKMVVDANNKFREVLTETYKMSQAFAHRYNMGPESRALANRVYSLQTADDIRKFIADLDKHERDYCGAAGLDCDFKNNQKIFRLSLRDTLFPDLRDIVDAKTGKVLTKGEQFHNAITSSPQWVRRYRRASGVRTQVVLPFTIWMQNQGSADASHYMVNPEECNHFIVGQRNGGASASGTIAVNVVGARLNQTVEYELWRGNTDYVRSCDEKESPVEPKVNVFTVGYAPQSSYGKMDVPPDFITHSTAFKACQNNWRLDDPNLQNNEDSCFNFFGRDRSLGAPDWKLVLPLVDNEQKWILGDGLPTEQKPLIEDIVIYFRYNSRPIVTD
ncbi:MAG: hypothetical protein MUC50_17345 [Myxococcota bacterium]|jgi:hypothetical protein|nr:hypothetical protein [Myxococcota bacterium]